MKQQQKQTTVFKYLSRELGLKTAITYTFTGFLALASHGRISGRFRVSKQEQSVEINVTGNDRGPLELKASIAGLPETSHQELLTHVQRDLDEVSSFLDGLV